jgi:hypothetical protein
MDDLERIKKAGKSRVDVTVGSALDIFGGDLPYKDVVLLAQEAKYGWSSVKKHEVLISITSSYGSSFNTVYFLNILGQIINSWSSVM